MAGLVRGIVSKKKLRFKEDGFDLDLTYITPNIIAMGFPSVGAEAKYRNPLPEVQRFFEKRHKGHFKIYNLCSEREYDAAVFEGNACRYPFDDHNPCRLDTIAPFCEDVDKFLAAHKDNVVAIHCKAGKGRTGLMVSAYLVHAKLQPTTTAALQYFGEMRTANGKGVTIPSQMRYVHYYEATLRRGKDSFPPRCYRLRHVRFHTVPNFDVGGGCDPYFDIRYQGRKKYFDWKKSVKKVKKAMPFQRYADLDCTRFNILIYGDVKFVFFDYDSVGSPDKMFHFWLNTGFIMDNYVRLHKSCLDRACKDTKCTEFSNDFYVELFLEPVKVKEAEFLAAYTMTEESAFDEFDVEDED